MEKWTDVFDVVDVTVLNDCRQCKGRLHWLLINRKSLEVVGVYLDQIYALKQGRYRHKKMLKRFEQILLVE